MVVTPKRGWFVIGLCFVLLSSVFFTDYISHLSQPKSVRSDVYHEPVGLAPCGEVCSYGGTVKEIPGQFYPQRHKHIDCNNIMKRMAFKGHPVVYPPPKYPPANLIDEFTMFGEMPINRIWYFDANWTATTKTFSRIQMRTIIEKLKKGGAINMYEDDKCVQNMLLKYKDEINGKSGVVIGTELPWLEALVLGYGAGSVTTLEYAPIITEMPNMAAYTPYDFAEKYLRDEVDKFDFAASFSSIEHAGLGRYTDPLNPYGDLEAMAQVWCMLKPGGIFALGVPGELQDSNYIIWNANRVYGSKRLQHLAANWDFVEMTQCPDIFHHYFIILKKPA